MIQISHVRIQNFLSFQGEVIVKDIYPISVFVGPNNAGKSNFIRLMSFYNELLLDSKEHNSNIKDKFHQLASKETFTISIRYKFDDTNFSHYPLEIDHFILFNEKGIFDKERLSLSKNGKSITVVKKENGQFLKQNDELVSEFLFDTKSRITTTNPEGIFDDIPRVKYAPFHWPDKDKDNNPGIKIFNEIGKFIASWIFIAADRLIEISKREKELQQRLYKKRKVSNNLANEMCKFVGVSDINFDDTDDKLTSYINDGPSISVELAGQGSGFQQIFTMYPQFYDDVDNTVIFIEEPEVHLHPLLQRKLLQLFIKRSETNQFFITTQSPIFCRYQENRIKPYLVKKDGYSTKIKELGGDEMNEINSVLGHVNSDLFGYNAVLFVEGDSEFKTIPLLARNLGIDIVNDGIRIVDSEGYGNMRQIKNIIDLLNDTATEVYAIFDNHAVSQGELQDIKNRLDKDNYTELQGSFEDSFDREILIRSLQAILHEKGNKLNDTEIITLKQQLASQSSAYGFLSDTYQRKTKLPSKLSKVSLGEHIANSLTKENQYLGESEPEKLIKKIHDKVFQQMTLE